MRVGWLLFWRAALVGFAIGLVIGFFGGLFSVPKYIYQGLTIIVSAMIAWPVVVSQMLKKKFNRFRIVLVRDNPTGTN